MRSSKTNDSDIEQIEQNLIRMEMELNEYYCEAGKIIIEKAGQHECKINNLVDTIIETRRQLALATQKKSCPDCNENNEQSNSYCKRCGYKFIIKNEIEGEQK